MKKTMQNGSLTGEAIAIIGMGCRYPGARGLQAFWELLRNGVDAITEIPPSRWDVDEFYDPDPAAPGKMQTRWGGFIDDIDAFDARFFNISPREANHMDPQQRQLLEVAWEALEHAGQTLEGLAGSQTGVFIATLGHDYDEYIFDDYSCIDAYIGTGNAHSLAANRLSYVFNLRGPSVALDSACSGSLVAIHLACQSLRSGESTMAIAGGVNAILLPKTNIFFSKAGAIAADGRCKTFDAQADGIVRSEGVGVVVLKRLSDALAAGDPIFALILGSAVNSDGKSNGLMAPNQDAQEALLREAYQRAGIDPSLVQYIEAHGTGTPLGDATELRALNAILGAGRSKRCMIGSVKTNIGHTEAAAGVAGVIKVALAMRHRQLPPSLHLREPNPALNSSDSIISVQTTLGLWPDPNSQLIAGVSAFGIGGTNAHIVMAEYVPDQRSDSASSTGGDTAELLTISARTQPALRELAAAYQAFLAETPPTDFANICYTATARRTHHQHRLALVARSPHHAAEQIDQFLRGESSSTVVIGQKQWDTEDILAFVFSGQGSHWLGMGCDLFEREPVFRDTLTACDELIQRHAGWSLLTELRADPEHSRLNDTDVTQPAIFAIQVALAALWRSWGIEPDVVVGHSLGEVAAAYVAGALSLEDAVRVVVHRSRLMRRVAGQGRTAVVDLPIDQAQLILAMNERYLSVAGSNSPSSTVLSGDPEKLEQALEFLERRGIFCRMLKDIDIAFHSPQMDPLRGELVEVLRDIRPRAGQVPIYSTVTGTRHDGAGLDAEYWGRNLREPFIFAATVQEMLKQGVNIFLEVSPHPVLGMAIRQGCDHAGIKAHVLASLRRDHDGRSTMLETLARFYTLGRSINWQTVHAHRGEVVQLPAYAWQRDRFWYYGGGQRPARRLAAPAPRRGGHPLLGRSLTFAVAPATRVWESEFSASSPASMRDHRVQGAIVVPGAAYVELALAAASELGLEHPVLEEVVFEQTFFLPEEGSRLVQVAVTSESSETSAFQIFSLPAGEAQHALPTLHARGRLRHQAAASNPQPVDLSAAQARCLEHIPGVLHYQRMSDYLGLQYGPAFQSVRDIWRRDGEVLSLLDLPTSLEGEAARCFIHPSLLDAAFQVVTATLPMHEGSATGDNTFLPVRLGHVRQFGRPGRRLWVHAILRSEVNLKASSHHADIVLLDEQGQVLVEIRDLLLLPLAGGRAAQQSPADWVYDLVWRAETPSLVKEPRQGAWFIIGDRAGRGALLAEALQERGERALLVGGESLELLLDETRPEALHEIIARAQSELEDDWAGVVYMCGLDAAPFEKHTQASLEAEQNCTVGGLIRLVQAMTARGMARPPRLWIVTSGAQAVTGTEAIAPAQASLWGLGRVLAREHNELRGGLIDLDPSDHHVAMLAEVLLSADNEDQIAIRAGQRFVCRLHRRQRQEQQRPWAWRPDAAYLITGGLGDLGLSIARSMINQGARRIILMGRTQLPERSSWHEVDPASRHGALVAAICELEALGASIQVASVDVANEGRLAEFFDLYRREKWPPIRGVVHAAGVLRDQFLASMSLDELREVLRPKVIGAWALHRLLRDEPLDFFVLFSSIASVLGSIGQGNYAAGNAFLDALAHYRRTRNLPAQSINWGPWAEIGMAARSGINDHLAANGIDAFTPQQGQQLFALLLDEDRPQSVAMAARWERWPQSQSDSTMLVADVLAAAGKEQSHPRAGTAVAPVHQELFILAQDQRRPYLERYLQQLAARVLRLDLAEIDIAQPLNTLGLDSIMALEFKNTIAEDTGVTLPIVAILQGPSISKFAEQILEQIRPSTEDDELERLLAEVESLSIEEARDMLAHEG
ncbi:MAG: polyketide synthase [Herpetosiphonaceae bacterium]|nr:MAG: polyketide synthase [Herpetosiphonaceae bacterium]